MDLILVTPPAALPVTLTEAKAHLRVETDEEDALIGGLIATATALLDGAAGELDRALVQQVWDVKLDGFPAGGRLCLPLTPVQSVDSILYRDAADTEQTFAAENYRLIGGGLAPQVELVAGAAWPATRDGGESVTVRLTCGYPPNAESPVDHAANLPSALKAAILLLVGHWYANREAVAVGVSVAELPLAVQRLLAPYKFYR